MTEDGGNGFGRTVAAQTAVGMGKQRMNDPLIGRVLDGRYQVEQVLGEGGMGIVYRAVHTTLGKPLAIKVLRPEVSRNEEILARFKREAQSASSIGNQHIIDISDFGTMPDGSTYFVMEFLGGRNLTKAISEIPFTPERVIRVAKQLCSALGAAHDIGVVHRDLKPDNVQLIDRGGEKDFVKVLDFGIAKVGGANSKLTQAGQVFGTPHYMSPEQCAGTNVDLRTDIYALGVMLYEMTTGKVPFDADNLMGILTKHLYENPIPPRDFDPPKDVPPALEAVIMKALSKKPETRYQSMAEMAADLDAIEKGLTPKAVIESVGRTGRSTASSSLSEEIIPRVSVGVPTQEIRIKKPLAPIIVGVAAVIVIAGGVAAMVLMPSTKPVDQAKNIVKPATAPALSAVPPKQADPTSTQTEAPSPQVKVKLSSEPSEVEVYLGDALVGNTPYELDQPKEGKPVELFLRKAGYEDKKVVISSRTNESMQVTLEKKREAVSPPSKPVISRTPKTKAAATKSSTTKSSTIKAPASKRPSERESTRIGPATEVLDPWN